MMVVAPDIISQLEIKPPVVSNTTSLFKDLCFVVPDYIPKLIEKYGNTSWAEWHNDLQLLEKDKTENPKLYEFTSFDNKL